MYDLLQIFTFFLICTSVPECVTNPLNGNEAESHHKIKTNPKSETTSPQTILTTEIIVSSKEVKQEIDLLEEILNKIMDAHAKKDVKLLLKGKILGNMEQVIRKGIKAETRVRVLSKYEEKLDKALKKIDALEISLGLRVLADEFFDRYSEAISDHTAEDDKVLRKYVNKPLEKAEKKMELKCYHILTDLYGTGYDLIDDIRNDLNETLPTLNETQQVELMCEAIVKMRFEVKKIVHEGKTRKTDGKIIAFNKDTLNNCINIFYQNMKPIENIRIES